MKRLQIQQGDRYNRLVVIEEVIVDNKPRRFLFKCDCGVEKVIALSNVRTGHTKSCGCIDLERKTKHGKSLKRSRLYNCWISMRVRSKERGSSCKIYPIWDDFLAFEKWALENGYNDQLVLCRNGDTGDYEPNNCRWDTQTSNAQESHAKVYEILKPNGDTEVIKNLSKFCREYNLRPNHLSSVATGKRKSHKGYKCRRIYDNSI